MARFDACINTPGEVNKPKQYSYRLLYVNIGKLKTILQNEVVRVFVNGKIAARMSIPCLNHIAHPLSGISPPV